MKKIAVFASGSGSNAEALVHFFKDRKDARVAMIVCNNPQAGVVERAHRLRIPLVMVSKRVLYEDQSLLYTLRQEGIDALVLAGFLWLVPAYLIQAYPQRIVNLHPALLPAFGGKGMYGIKVHEAVIAAGEKESGISIHLVNEHYDKGQLLAQFRTPIAAGETAESLAEKIHQLEHRHFPETVATWLVGFTN